MKVKPQAVFVWGAFGFPLFGVAVALDGLFTLGLWALGGIFAMIVLRHCATSSK